MSTRQRLLLPAMLIGATTLLAACGASASGAAPTDATPATPAPTVRPSPTMAGPTSYADWVARQGFGGSSGLREIAKGAHWLQSNAGASDAAEMAWWWNDSVEMLQLWLDTHPATPCWADLHEHMRTGLADVHATLATMRATLDAGQPRPQDAASHLVEVADELLAVPDPAGCA